LAFLALLIAVYKIWRFYPTSPNISKLAYSAGIATAVYGLLTTFAEYELLKS
jgi:hypothetical protein